MSERKDQEHLQHVQEAALSLRNISWKTKFTLLTGDGENIITSCNKRGTILFVIAAEQPLIRIWCGLHKLGLNAQENCPCYFDDQYPKILLWMLFFNVD